jgi:hypothetical protein
MKTVLPTIIVVFFLVALAAWIISAFVGGPRRNRGERDES